ncbi:methyltransferase domain-containing protein [Candidatus Saccharibacteria bacterium]|nr:methyltransferase domain-containing protein [Candidatus Saccharibacteria bacterium]
MTEPKLTDFTQPTPQLVEWTRDLVPGSALDIGTGNGRNALFLAREGWAVTANDTDQALLTELAKSFKSQNLTGNFIEGNISNLDLHESYDLVVCLMVLHFLDALQIIAAVDRLKAVTKPGGCCIISAFTDANPTGTRPYLFAHNGLRDAFATWNILHYEEHLGSWVLPPGKTDPIQYMTARVLAEKPAV